MAKRPVPNTGDVWQGHTPGQLIYEYCKERHVCPRCRARWTEANTIVCALCESAIETLRKKNYRSKNPLLARKKFATQLDVVCVRTLRNGKFSLYVRSDIGELFAYHNVESIDLRDAMQGAVRVVSFRPPKPQKEELERLLIPTPKKKRRVA